MMKKKWNLIKLFPIIGMVIIVVCMIVSFLKIDKIQLDIKSGDFVIVSYELDNDKTEMKAIENKKEELAKIIKMHNLQAEIFTIAIPDFTAYKTYSKNKVSPYSIQIADDSFFNYYGINNPNDSVLYRFDNEESGNLDLKFLKDEDKAEFESFPIEGKAILDRNRLPKFIPQKSNMPSGDFITLRTFDMLKEKVNVIKDTHVKDYYVYIKSAYTDQISQLLDKEENVIVSDQMSESSVFDNWYKCMIFGTLSFIVLAVFEIVIIVKRKNVS